MNPSKKKPKNISISAGATRLEKQRGERPLGELLDEAWRVVDPSGYETGCPRTFVARLAVRAVCEEIIRRGCLVMPLEVEFSNVDLGDEVPPSRISFTGKRWVRFRNFTS